MAGPCFIMDANTLIEPYRREYAFDICPGYWDLMARALREGLVISHAKVRKEITGSDDALAHWVKGLDAAFFPSETADEFAVWQGLCSWVRGKGYTSAAITQFTDLDYADPWICAKAKCQGLVLVTQEVSAPMAKRSVKLPDACDGIGVPCCDMFAMLRELKARFVLDEGHSF